MRKVAFVFALLFSCGFFFAACLPNTCFIKVCTNGDCKCPVNSCTEGADYDLKRKGCFCVEGRLSVQGQCMTQEGANAYCGQGYTYGANGCETAACEAGLARDEATGACVATDQVAKNMGVEVGEGEKLSCPEGSTLVIEGSSGACVPNDSTCARDEAWDGKQCSKVASCPTGSAYNAAKGQCVAYTKSGQDSEIDVQRWAESNYGPNGGTGAGTFCNQFSRKPWSFGVPQGQSATVQVAINMGFPGGDVKQGTVTTEPTYVGNTTAVPPKGRESVQSSANSLFSGLKAGGGKASASQAKTVVKCRVVNAAAPVVVPAAGGF
jgi:hypothetical protein